MEVALLEDDPLQAEVMKLWLEAGLHRCRVFGTGADFMQGVSQTHFDLLVIDWMLPDTDGDKVLVWVRENLGWHLPVLFVTGRDAENDVVKALRLGADDYMIKPVKHMEMLARIEVLGRRSAAAPKLGRLHAGCYEIDLGSRRILRSGVAIELTQKEFELAVYLFQNPGRLLSRVNLLENVWGRNADVDTRTIDTHISRLRKKLKLPGSGWSLIPVYGYGYRFETAAPSAENPASS